MLTPEENMLLILLSDACDASALRDVYTYLCHVEYMVETYGIEDFGFSLN